MAKEFCTRPSRNLFTDWFYSGADSTLCCFSVWPPPGHVFPSIGRNDLLCIQTWIKLIKAQIPYWNKPDITKPSEVNELMYFFWLNAAYILIFDYLTTCPPTKNLHFFSIQKWPLMAILKKKFKKNCLFIWNGEKCDWKWFLGIQIGYQWPFYENFKNVLC